jgi:deoxyribodipyrimidine photolyase
MRVTPQPDRETALARLAAFLPHAGEDYERWRNHDFGPGGGNRVSGLSPWLRHRLIGEDEVVDAVLRHHGLAAAEKFIQEVCWRTYWKGFLERRPVHWREYRESGHDRSHGYRLFRRLGPRAM